MSNSKNDNKSVLQRWHMAGIVLALCLGACATLSDESESDGVEDLATATAAVTATATVTVTDEDGAVLKLSELDSLDLLSPEDTADDLADRRGGCTHIRFCNATGSEEVVCDTNDRACSPGARLTECIKDANYVCGDDWRKMQLDPRICFPAGCAAHVYRR